LRPEARAESNLFDLLFELKYVSLGQLKTSGDELRQLGDEELRALPAVARTFEEAREQIDRYRRAFGDRATTELRLACYAIVAVGFERLVGAAM
jgi:hypothetical protein